MIKRILIISATILAFVSIGAYFFFVSKLSRDGRDGLLCTNVNVIIKDSLENTFITPGEVSALMNDNVVGMQLDSLDTYLIEKDLAGKDVIAYANAYISSSGNLTVEVTQRRPVVRFQSGDSGCFADGTGFILPLSSNHPLNLPVVTGSVPFSISESSRGYTEDAQWMDNLLSVSEYIRDNAYWSEEIEQIHIEPNGDFILYPKGREFKVIFGGADNRDAKFDKLSAFYKSVMLDESKKYTVINLKYKDLIVCK